jgi:hypothetical protein
MPLPYSLSRTFKKRLCWSLCFFAIVVTASIYHLSGPWAAQELISTLQTQNIVDIKKKIPQALITDMRPHLHSEKNWQGAGGNYLRHVEPRLYAETDQSAWFIIQAQVQINQATQHYYTDYFNHYVLDLGIEHDQIRIEFKRKKFIDWHIVQICYPNPQPDWVVSRCPSSNR